MIWIGISMYLSAGLAVLLFALLIDVKNAKCDGLTKEEIAKRESNNAFLYLLIFSIWPLFVIAVIFIMIIEGLKNLHKIISKFIKSIGKRIIDQMYDDV